MSMKAYLDNIQAKTGKTVADFRAMAAEKGLVKSGEIVAWLKADFGLGHGHAQAIAANLTHPDFGKTSPEDRFGALFAGNKAHWREAFDALIAQLKAFGSDVDVSANQTYVNVNRGKKKFAILQASGDRFDIGIKLKGLVATERLEIAGSWNAMVTHRVRVTDATQMDAEVLDWLRRAYDAA